MRRFKNVLVCIDDDAEADLALEHGAAVASRAGASLKVLEVIREGAQPSLLPGCKRRVRPHSLLQQREYLARLAMPLRGHGLQVTAALRRGAPAMEITREVLRARHDMAVRVDRGRPQRFFRETTMIQLARSCPCPLWVVRPAGARGREHLLAAVNVFESSEDLAVEILENALAIAWLLGRRLHVVHAWDAPGVRLLAARTSDEYLAEYLASTRQQHQEQLDRLMSRYAAAIPRDRVHLRQGRPTDVIARVADELGADPIVMGSVARRGVLGWLIGNTAERMMHQTDRSVVIVKPRGFVSPAAERPARARSLPPRDPTGRTRRGTWQHR